MSSPGSPAGGSAAPVPAYEPDLLPVIPRPARALLAKLILRSKDRVDPRLRRAVKLPHHRAEGGLGAHLQRVRTWRRAQDERTQRAHVARSALLRVDQPPQQDRKSV